MDDFNSRGAFLSFVGIIVGIGLAHLFERLVLDFSSNGHFLITAVPGPVVWSALAGGILMVRVYYKNTVSFIEHSVDPVRGSGVIDWLVILSQGVLLSLLGFFLVSLRDFWLLVLVICGIDLVWLLVWRHLLQRPEGSRDVSSSAAVSGLLVIAIGLTPLVIHARGGFDWWPIGTSIVVMLGSGYDLLMNRGR